ncbi:MAG: AAA family ATPase [Candidatus Omnitrophica bacterium]|nr:AAA family ATPase [Candidatus Omnitrophota bacterium]
MYKKFYGLKENPFNVTSDPSFFFSSTHHAEAFSHLVYGIQQRKGIILITGEVGTGKTILCRTLLNQLDQQTKTAFILYPNFSELQLLQMVIRDFGITIKSSNKAVIINALNEFLLHETNQGHNVVLIIDEAQNLKESQLEQIRLLSNLETEKDKLLQIILVGQPELCDKLQLTSLRQLNQRITIRNHIRPLERPELKSYITHRLNVAGAQKPINFTDETLEEIYLYSSGTPRLINIICDRALLAGFVAEVWTIDYNIIKKCIEEIS